MLNIEKTIENGALSFALGGELNTLTVKELKKEVDSSIVSATSVTFDLKELEYISSAGLRVLLATQKKMQGQGTMTVTGVNDIVMEVFEVTGFCDILNIA